MTTIATMAAAQPLADPRFCRLLRPPHGQSPYHPYWHEPPPDKPRTVEQISPAVRAAIRACVEGRAPWPLVLLGLAGVGKTCAALAMLDVFGGWYATVPALCALLNSAREGSLYHPGPTGGRCWPRDLWSAWRTQPLVTFDELGARAPTDAQYEAVKEAIEGRYGKPAVFVSNLALERLAAVFDTRIVSRLAEGNVIEVSGPDRRLRRA